MYEGVGVGEEEENSSFFWPISLPPPPPPPFHMPATQAREVHLVTAEAKTLSSKAKLPSDIV